MMDEIKVYTVPEVAEILQCTPDYVYDRIREGSMSHFRIGRKIRLNREQIDDYLKTKEVPRKKVSHGGES